jgi:AraC family transcriptional activator of pobA
MKPTTLDDFYKHTKAFLPARISREIGHFNVFNVEEMAANFKGKPYMTYNKRSFYKIGLKRGHNIVKHADKTIEIKSDALLFSSPEIPSGWIPKNENQKGHICIFTDEFLMKNKSGFVLDELPIFKAGSYPIFPLSSKESKKVNELFLKMHTEIDSDYAFKYDLIRNYVLELIHFGQKLLPSTNLYPATDASSRIVALFIELLERQFPIEAPSQKINLVTAKDYADKLSVHVNHLNRVLKEKTGKTTTEILCNRITGEAKLLLKTANWTISEVAYSLGFDELAHFSNFFKKNTSLTPSQFRN